MASYPSPEDKEFMKELKSVFPNVRYESEKGPAGVLVFPKSLRKHGGHWK